MGYDDEDGLEDSGEETSTTDGSTEEVIKDLQDQLAEKDEEIKEAEEIIKNLEAENDRLTKLIESLKVSDD